MIDQLVALIVDESKWLAASMGSDVVRIENGKAVERWGVEDMSGFVPQG